jgi:hypothetical protein
MSLAKEDRKVRLFRHRRVVGTHWVWTGARINPKKLYGSMDGRPVHAVSYEEFVGPIPAGHEVHHTCPVKLCFNPAHLKAVLVGPHRTAHLLRPVTCKNGHTRTDDNTYVRPQGWLECRDCRREREAA